MLSRMPKKGHCENVTCGPLRYCFAGDDPWFGSCLEDRTLARSSLMAIGKHVFGWIVGVPAALLTLIYVLAHI